MTSTCYYEIPFHEKELDYTCGAAALRMAIHALTGVDFSEALIAKILGSTSNIGSPLKLFEDNFEKISDKIFEKSSFQISWIIGQNSSFTELKRLLSQKYILMLNHKKQTGGSHWAILNSINDHEMVLVDPDFGPNKNYLLDDFDWRGGTKIPTTKAYIAIRLI